MKTFGLFALCAVLFGCESQRLRFEETACDPTQQVTLETTLCYDPTACCELTNLEMEVLCNILYPGKTMPFVCHDDVDMKHCQTSDVIVDCLTQKLQLTCCAYNEFY